VGFLPELSACVACGRTLNGSRAFYHALADGLMCEQHKRLASSQLGPESRAMAAQMFRAPVESFGAAAGASGDDGPAAGRAGAQYADLRRFLVQIVERHIEKKLVTAGMLAKL
jgi:DNA repair protein RecO (recombination protein O)